MFGKRLALGVLVASLSTAAFGGISSSSGQPAPAGDKPGVNYGGSRAEQYTWLRLTPSRTLVVLMQIPYQVANERCSHGKGYGGAVLAGADFDELIFIRDGKFKKTVREDFRFRGARYQESVTVTGTVMSHRVTGSLAGKVKITAADGKVIRCTFGPQRWTVVD